MSTGTLTIAGGRRSEHVGGAGHHLAVGQHVGAAELHLARASSASSATSASARTTSPIATGCERVSTQRGVIMTGRRRHEVAKHLERGASLPDDHRRAHVDELRDALAQQLGDLVAGAQVLGGVLARRAEPAEVDDALDARLARGLAEVDGRLAVAAGEVVVGRSRGPSSGSGSRRCGSRRAPRAGRGRTGRRRCGRRRRPAAASCRGRARARGRCGRGAAAPRRGSRRRSRGAGDERGIGFTCVLGHRARYGARRAGIRSGRRRGP